jgi:redox-sensing transcriptional repressor
MPTLPHKTIERLSQYRRLLLNLSKSGKDHVFSHDVASLLHITPVQVRRDIMLIGYNWTHRKGYNINGLIEIIGKLIDTEKGQKVALVGVGNLGRAIINYLSAQKTKLSIIAVFDNNPEKVGKKFSGVPCYHIDDINKIVKKEGITIGVLTVPPDTAADVADSLVKAGIKGILNYASSRLNVPDEVYLEEYDIITSLEKVSYFAKK